MNGLVTAAVVTSAAATEVTTATLVARRLYARWRAGLVERRFRETKREYMNAWYNWDEERCYEHALDEYRCYDHSEHAFFAWVCGVYWPVTFAVIILVTSVTKVTRFMTSTLVDQAPYSELERRLVAERRLRELEKTNAKLEKELGL